MADNENVLRARSLLKAHSLAELPSAERFSSKRGSDDEAFFAAMLEAAFLVTAADGELSVEEAGSLVDVISQVGEETITPGQLAESVHEFAEALEKEGRGARVEALSKAVTEDGARREVLGFASLVALCDHELAPSELFVLHSIGKGFGIDPKGVNGIIKSVREAMGE